MNLNDFSGILVFFTKIHSENMFHLKKILSILYMKIKSKNHSSMKKVSLENNIFVTFTHEWIKKKKKKKISLQFFFPIRETKCFVFFSGECEIKWKKKQFRDVFFSCPLEKQNISVSQKDKFNQG